MTWKQVKHVAGFTKTHGPLDHNQWKLTYAVLIFFPLSYFPCLNLFLLSLRERKRERVQNVQFVLDIFFFVFFLSYSSLTRVVLSPSFRPLFFTITLMWWRSSLTNLCLPSHMSYPHFFSIGLSLCTPQAYCILTSYFLILFHN